MSQYITVAKYAQAQITEKKSKFICSICHADSEEMAEEFVKTVKKKYYDARHNVYAYIIGDGAGKIKKYSDDGEPSRTGGYPVLEMLEREGISDVVCVVTRYFGGVLLGTGGLIRAYTLSAQTGLEEAGRHVMENCEIFDITVPYNLLSTLEYIIKTCDGEIEDKQYLNDVTVTAYTKKNNAPYLIEQLEQQLSPNVTVKSLGIERR